MRRALTLVALMAVMGCKREPTFDDRYNATANAIGQRAAGIERRLNAADTASKAD